MAPKKKPAAASATSDFESLVLTIAQIHQQAQAFVIKAVNVGLTLRNWLIGHRIVEFEQNGNDRAAYGARLLPALAKRETLSPESPPSQPDLLQRLSFSHLAELLELPDETQRSAQIIRDPYIFEFLGLRSRDVMGESDLEDALLDRLQDFLLEMGHGFCFEARQKRILIGDEHFFVDLVFYHRVLKCHVLVELKTQAFSHENLGQLNTYVAYYKKHEMTAGDQAPIGILLCTRKNEALVEFALGDIPNKLFVSRYAVEMPKKQEMKKFLQQVGKEIGHA